MPADSPNKSNLLRDARRGAEVLSVLARHGWAEIISRLVPGNLTVTSTGSASPERLCDALLELGTTAIKFGQVLSTRPDLIGQDYANALERLQASVPADPPEFVRARLEEDLGGTLEELFESFELDALASASIGQVHRACLLTGEDVVVKVRHQGVSARVYADLSILMELAHQAERIPEFACYRPVAVVTAFRADFKRGARGE